MLLTTGTVFQDAYTVISSTVVVHRHELNGHGTVAPQSGVPASQCRMLGVHPLSSHQIQAGTLVARLTVPFQTSQAIIVHAFGTLAVREDVVHLHIWDFTT